MPTALIDGFVEAPVEPGTDAREAVAVLPTERLEAEITRLAGQLAAGECRWLLLVAESAEGGSAEPSTSLGDRHRLRADYRALP